MTANIRKLVIILFLASIVFIGLLTLGFSYFTTSGFCVICHSMKPEYEAWKKSSHAKVPCMACHLPPGGSATLIWDHVKAGKLVVAQIMGYEKPINAESEISQKEIEVERCERCHSPENRNFTPKTGLKIGSQAHVKHIKAGLLCTTCHNRVAHKAMDDPGAKYDKGEKGEGFKYKNFLKMKEGCLRCHNQFNPYKSPVNGAVAPVKCITCHDKQWKLMPKSHDPINGKTWKVGHREIARKDWIPCLDCHESKGDSIGPLTGIKSCYSCHKTEVPHGDGWRDLHGAKVVKLAEIRRSPADKLLCYNCHKTELFCSKCHKSVIFPHPENWPDQHGKQAVAKGKATCYTCHRQSLCTSCHRGVSVPHKPKWLGEHRKFLRTRSPQQCLGCHVKQQCEQCHSAHKVHNRNTLYKYPAFREAK